MKHIHSLSITTITSIFVCLPHIAQAASFDCKIASTQVEKIICTDPSLSRLDDDLAAAYRRTKEQVTSNNNIVQDQQRWLLHRNKCKDTRCLRDAYKARISELNRQFNLPYSKSIDSESPIIGDWGGGSEAFENDSIHVSEKTVALLFPGDGATYDKCKKIPYVILLDESGYGPSPIPQRPNGEWRKIAIELVPENEKQNKCIESSHTRVMVFSIPKDLQCHADIAMFETRQDFQRMNISGWGVWGKNCAE